jgi:DNA-binding NarL/FixJ family response regulator
LIIGEHKLSRAFAKAWFGRRPGIKVCAATGPAAVLLRLARRWRPDLVVMDLEPRPAVGLRHLKELHAAHPRVKTLVYFAYAHENTAIQVVRAGATGFVLKSAQGEELDGAIRTVLAGGIYLSPSLLRFVGRFEGLRDSAGEPLGPRQAELLRLAAAGCSTKVIAAHLKVGAKTVALQKRALARRLGLEGADGLLGYAVAAGLGPAEGGGA